MEKVRFISLEEKEGDVIMLLWVNPLKEVNIAYINAIHMKLLLGEN